MESGPVQGASRPAEAGAGRGCAGVMLYDGACPFCSREKDLLQRADAGARVRFVDISDPAFDPGAYGLTREEADAQLHFFDAEGRVFRAMDAVRAAYRAAGIGWRMAWTGLPLLRPIFDRFYRAFARNRIRWGRRLTRGLRKRPDRSREG